LCASNAGIPDSVTSRATSISNHIKFKYYTPTREHCGMICNVLCILQRLLTQVDQASQILEFVRQCQAEIQKALVHEH
jgi:hypothetical protein